VHCFIDEWRASSTLIYLPRLIAVPPVPHLDRVARGSIPCLSYRIVVVRRATSFATPAGRSDAVVNPMADVPQADPQAAQSG
jgi:hypothetical protein